MFEHVQQVTRDPEGSWRPLKNVADCRKTCAQIVTSEIG